MEDAFARGWAWLKRPRRWWVQGLIWFLALALALGLWPLALALYLTGRTESGPVVSRYVPLALAVLWVPYVLALSTTSDQPPPATTAETTTSTGQTQAFADIPDEDEGATATTSSTTTLAVSTSAQATTTSDATTTTDDAPTTTATTPAHDQEGLVLSITDGDTIRVLIDGVDEPLRLIGINAPENQECMADEATERLNELVDGQVVGLDRDQSERDQFDRLLRYVYVGNTFVNEVLVEEGLAIARRYEPDTALAAALEAAQDRAQAVGVGMWEPNACGAEASDELRIGTIRYDADGNDNFNLNDEWIEIDNVGGSAAKMTGWVVKDETASHRFNFPTGFVLAADATVRIHTGCGTDTATFLYWCNTGSAIWNNSGDTAFLLDPAGNIIDTKTY